MLLKDCIFTFSIHQAGHVFTGRTSKVGKTVARVRVWAWFSESGAGEIRRVAENFTDENYVEMLDEALIPGIWARFGDNSTCFLRERKNVYPSSFSSIVVRDWFRERKELKPQFYPYGKDINPFKTIWHNLEGSLRLQRLQPQDCDELWEGIQELWEYRTAKPLFWEGLVKSFRADLQDIVKVDGDRLLPD